MSLAQRRKMVNREHLALWLGVSEGRVSQMVRSLVNTWGLIERRGKRGDTRYTLSAEGIRYVTHRDRAQLPTTQGIWSTALTTDKQGRRRHVGHRIETWARQTNHADGITGFLSKLEAEARDDPDSDLVWSIPTTRSDRAYNWGDSAIAPAADFPANYPPIDLNSGYTQEQLLANVRSTRKGKSWCGSGLVAKLLLMSASLRPWY